VGCGRTLEQQIVIAHPKNLTRWPFRWVTGRRHAGRQEEQTFYLGEGPLRRAIWVFWIRTNSQSRVASRTCYHPVATSILKTLS